MYTGHSPTVTINSIDILKERSQISGYFMMAGKALLKLETPLIYNYHFTKQLRYNYCAYLYNYELLCDTFRKPSCAILVMSSVDGKVNVEDVEIAFEQMDPWIRKVVLITGLKEGNFSLIGNKNWKNPILYHNQVTNYVTFLCKSNEFARFKVEKMKNPWTFCPTSLSDQENIPFLRVYLIGVPQMA